MAGVSAQIESGQMMLPVDASWLADFKAEILGFPSARHDDQADALTQLMSWVLRGQQNQPTAPSSPILFVVNEDGEVEQFGGDFDFGDCSEYDGDPWGAY